MTSLAYYNERDPHAAQWLRNLIAAGHIAPGIVDDRDIRKVLASDLAGYSQCHFFAGIGVWSHALRSAGWPDDRPAWTGSCPCQPFSNAGRGAGFDDDRHLWPEWIRLIRECRPVAVFGEQVASPDGLGWLDLVSLDLEGEDYAVGTVDTCAAGVGAPHIRQRLYFMADADRERLAIREQWRCILGGANGAPAGQAAVAGGDFDLVADALRAGRTEGRSRAREGQVTGVRDVNLVADAAGEQQRARRITAAGKQSRTEFGPARPRPPGRVADTDGDGRAARIQRGATVGCGSAARPESGGVHRPGAVNGWWQDADWLGCTDGKFRAVETGTQPLAHGITGRVGRLRAYGNALCAPQAEAFVRAAIEALDKRHGRVIVDSDGQ